jgi:hypothetical protein
VTPARAHPDWLRALRRCLAAVAVGNLAWETAQLPLYTLWQTGSSGDIAFAVLHCTAGDALIATGALVAALIVLGSPDWPWKRAWSVGAAGVAIGLGYTTYSEHLNTAVRKTWAYSDLMPTLPWPRTGLAPVAQWLLVPTLSLAWGCHAGHRTPPPRRRIAAQGCSPRPARSRRTPLPHR